MNSELRARKDALRFIWLMLGKNKEDQLALPNDFKESDIDIALRTLQFGSQWEGKCRFSRETSNSSLVIEYSRKGMFDSYPVVTIRVSNSNNFSLAVIRFDGKRRAMIDSENLSGLNELQLSDYEKIVRWLKGRKQRQKTWKLSIQAQAA